MATVAYTSQAKVSGLGSPPTGRSAWDSLSVASVPYRGTWRRRTNPTGGTQAQSAGLGAVFSGRSSNAWYRQARVGGVRLVASSMGLSAGRFAMGGTAQFMGDSVYFGAGIDASVGNPAPSLRLSGNGRWSRTLKVTTGARIVHFDAFQPDSRRARPTLRIVANASVGVVSDIVVTASASAGWVSMTQAVTITANGGLTLELVNPEPRFGDAAWFDNIWIE